MSYIIAGYTVAGVTLAGYGALLWERRRRLERLAARLGAEPDTGAGPTR